MTMTKMIPAEAFPMTDFLKEEMEARGWSQADLSQIVGKSPRDIHSLVNGKVTLKPEMATLLGDAFGTGPEYWMNLETSYRAWLTSRATRETVSRRGLLYELAPVREMLRRRWIRPADDIGVLEKQVTQFFGVPDVESLRDLPLPFAAKMTADYKAPTTSHKAWMARARNLAQAVSVNKSFSDAAFNDCLASLRLLLNDPEETRHVPRVLADHGIRFLVIEHLPQTRLDGGCVWLDQGSPVVALSMRFERLDWFWFTLIHELGHVKARDGQGRDGIVDIALVGQDATAREDKSETEKAADLFAEDFLVSRAELENFVDRVRPLYSKERIRLFAKRLDVHPAFVVGQLQHRKEIEYSHSRDVLRDKLRGAITANALTDGWGYEPLTV